MIRYLKDLTVRGYELVDWRVRDVSSRYLMVWTSHCFLSNWRHEYLDTMKMAFLLHLPDTLACMIGVITDMTDAPMSITTGESEGLEISKCLA